MLGNGSTKITWGGLLIILLFITVLVSAAYFGYRSSVLKSSIEQARVEVKEQELLLMQNKYDADQRNKYEEVVKSIIPTLLSKDKTVRTAALAILFALYPEDSKQILEAVRTATPDYFGDTLKEASIGAEKLEETKGEWLIIISANKKLKDAQLQQEKAEYEGYQASIYLKDQWFTTVVGPYPDGKVTKSTLIPVRAKLNKSSYPVNIKRWCEEETQKKGYYLCKSY